LREREGLADLAEGESVGFLLQGGFEALDGFVDGFFAEDEDLVVHGHEVAGACGVGHSDGLFGSAMVPDPRLVGCDGHDGEGVGAGGSKPGEGLGHGGVTAEDEGGSFTAEDVSVIAARFAVGPSLAPMSDLGGFDVDFAGRGLEGDRFAPAELGDFAAAGVVDEVGGVFGGNDGQVLTKESSQGAHVEVVHVRMGQEDEVQGR